MRGAQSRRLMIGTTVPLIGVLMLGLTLVTPAEAAGPKGNGDGVTCVGNSQSKGNGQSADCRDSGETATDGEATPTPEPQPTQEPAPTPEPEAVEDAQIPDDEPAEDSVGDEQAPDADDETPGTVPAPVAPRPILVRLASAANDAATGCAPYAFYGQTVSELDPAMREQALPRLWGQDVRGVLHVYVVGAPAFVNQPFSEALGELLSFSVEMIGCGLD